MLSRICKSRMHIFVVFALIALYALEITAQVSSGTLRGQVTDPSGALIRSASVAVKTPGGKSITTKTDGVGSYEIKDLLPGQYSVEVTAPGFTLFTGTVKVLAGQTQRLDAALQISVLRQQIVVEGNHDSGGAPTLNIDPNRNAGGIVISGKDLDALAEDPDDLQSELQELAGPAAGPNGGQIYIDGFSGGQLPPKSMIREIRINQNPFGADKDKVGFGRVEVLTKPGTGQIHGQVSFNNNDSFLNTRNPFLGTIPDYQTNFFNSSIGGPLTKKASFFVAGGRRDINEASAVSAIVLDSNFNAVPVNQAVSNPKILTGISPRLDYQLNQNNVLTLRYQYTATHEKNDGIDQLDLASFAFNTDRTEHDLQLSDIQLLSPRVLNEVRFEYKRSAKVQTSLNSAPEIDVAGAFNGGGNAVGDNSTTSNYYELQNQVSISHGTHLWKFGGRLRTEQDVDLTTSNFNGLYSFESLDAYRITLQGLQNGLTPVQIRAAGGGASQFLISLGQPLASAAFADVGLYFQDDWKARSNLVISYGLRYETQNAIHDKQDLAPRITLAWGLGGGKNASPKMVMRAGFGVFYDRFPANFILSAQHQNGINQQLFLIQSPEFFPAIPAINDLTAGLSPPSIWQLSPNLRAPYFAQTGVSFERQLSRTSTLSVIYLNSRGFHQFLSRNINTPLPGTFIPGDPTSGVRPLGNIGNIFEFESEGITKQHQMISNVTIRGGARFSLFSNYTLNFASSNTAGAFYFPFNVYDMKQDYGRAAFDIRHRIFVGGNWNLRHAFSITPFLEAESGRPFNIIVGKDLNGDSHFNDRPAFATDLSRPSVVITRLGAFDTSPLPGQKAIPPYYGTGSPKFTLNFRLSKTFGFGEARKQASNSAGGGVAGGSLESGGLGDSVPHPYRLTLSVSARNVFNYTNLGVPVSDLSSPLFGLSTGIAGAPFSSSVANRRIDLRAQFSF